MPRILANDGIDPAGKKILEEAGIEVVTAKVPQEDLVEELKNYDGILVRSATKVRKDIVDACSNLKLIGRGGVGMDNIDVEYARSKGVTVINTPKASSLSVAELVFAHLFGMVRFLHDANRCMPKDGCEKFNDLKKKYAEGRELRGKTLGILGFGNIGQETAKIALGLGMKVIAFNRPPVRTVELTLNFPGFPDKSVTLPVQTCAKEEVLKNSDFISLHVPAKKGDAPILSKEDFQMMKDGVGIVNCARGGVIIEKDLIEALNSGKVAFAGIDVFEEEPTNNKELLAHPKVSLTPHIGASTSEAQERVGIEIAELVRDFFNNKN